ncbi:hypothetical protein T484DRAFT_1967411 [Baffinella frigidus]|nr:hypothetical protein T484DRAFT_1967411 [Cryptophyta sp. CCMP2293]
MVRAAIFGLLLLASVGAAPLARVDPSGVAGRWVSGAPCGVLTSSWIENGIKGTGRGGRRSRVNDVMRLGGGGVQGKEESLLSDKVARVIRFVALGLHVWGWMAGHCENLTVISPTLPVVGKLPVTFSLPEPSIGAVLQFYDQGK